MKFRSVIRETNCMRDFYNIIVTLTKLTKEVVLDVSADKLILAANDPRANNTAPLVWIELKPNLYFEEFRIENKVGVDDTGTEHILLSLSIIHLCRALAVLRQNTSFCVLKLTRVEYPCLTIEATVENNYNSQSRTRLINHDIPVTIISRDDWSLYMLPQVPKPVMIFKVPSDRMMRNLIDKLKNLSPTIIFHASQRGEINIIIETELAVITTHYNNLQLIGNGNAKNAISNSNFLESKCAVDCKKLAIFFSAIQLDTVELSFAINEECIHLQVNARPGIIINSLLPAVCM